MIRALMLCLILFASMHSAANVVSFADAYRFGPGDAITINVYQEPDLSYSGEISQQGTIDFPLLGSIRIAELTQANAKKHLETLLRDGYLVNPSVSIRVTNYRPFFIYGEVRSPGSYPYQPDITLEQVIALAGGLKDRASREKWAIQRGAQKATFQAKADTIILPGDVIKIEKSFF